jgi:hypothetical protein
MASPWGELACRLTKKANKAEELTYLSVNIEIEVFVVIIPPKFKLIGIIVQLRNPSLVSQCTMFLQGEQVTRERRG